MCSHAFRFSTSRAASGILHSLQLGDQVARQTSQDAVTVVQSADDERVNKLLKNLPTDVIAYFTLTAQMKKAAADESADTLSKSQLSRLSGHGGHKRRQTACWCLPIVRLRSEPTSCCNRRCVPSRPGSD